MRVADNWDSRVSKYEHRLQEVFNFTRPETAVLCVLIGAVRRHGGVALALRECTDLTI